MGQRETFFSLGAESRKPRTVRLFPVLAIFAHCAPIQHHPYCTLARGGDLFWAAGHIGCGEPKYASRNFINFARPDFV